MIPREQKNDGTFYGIGMASVDSFSPTRARSRSNPLNPDIFLKNRDAPLDPLGDVDGVAPGEARVEDDDGKRQIGDGKRHKSVKERQIPAKQNGVDEVTNQIEGRADDQTPIEPMRVGITPIQRTP